MIVCMGRSGASLGAAILVPSYLVLYLVWGANPLFIKRAVATIPVEWVLAIRFTAAGLVFLLARLKSLRTTPVTSRQVGSALLMSLLLLVTGNGMTTLAHRHIDSYAVCLMATTIPLFVAAYDRLLFGIRIPALSRAGIVLGVVGVGLLLYDGRDLVRSFFAWGNVPVLVGNLSWSLGASIGKRLPAFEDGVVNAGLQMLACGVLALLFALARTPDIGAVAAGVTRSSVVGLLYITVLGGTAFAVFNYLVPREPSVRLASYTLVNPVVAVAIGIGLGGERPTPYLAPAIAATLCGVACILYGGWLSQRILGLVGGVRRGSLGQGEPHRGRGCPAGARPVRSSRGRAISAILSLHRLDRASGGRRAP